MVIASINVRYKMDELYPIDNLRGPLKIVWQDWYIKNKPSRKNNLPAKIRSSGDQHWFNLDGLYIKSEVF